MAWPPDGPGTEEHLGAGAFLFLFPCDRPCPERRAAVPTHRQVPFERSAVSWVAGL